MPNFFQDHDSLITTIERWQSRKQTVQATADSITPEQAVNISRLARMFPFMSPGVVRGLGQMGMGPDDSAVQFAVTQEMLRNYSTVGDWSGQIGRVQRQTNHPTESDPDAVTRRITSGDEARALNSSANPANKFAAMERAQGLLAEGETAGVFNPTTQMLVEPEFGTPEYDLFTKLQDTIWDISKSYVPYLAKDGKIRGFTPTSGTTGDRELNLKTGEAILPEDMHQPEILGAYRNPSGVGGSIGRVEDYGRGEQQQLSSDIISQIFADNEAKATERTLANAQAQLGKPAATGQGITGLPGPQTLTRPAFLAFDAPLQEIQGQARNIYGAMHGEDVDWLQSQSDLGIVLPKLFKGQDVNVGDGFFVDPESAVARERRAREASRGKIGDHNITIGRILANTVTEPDTKPFQIISGLTDGAAQIYADPTTWALGGVGNAQDARKFFAAADDAGEQAGIFRGLRAHFDPPTFKQWANKNTDLIDKLAETTDPYDIARLTNFKLEPSLTANLAGARKPEDIRGILDGAINRGRILTTTELEGTRTQRAMQGWDQMHRTLNPSYNPRTLRVAKMMPAQTLDLEDPAQVANNLTRVMQNAHAHEDDIRAVYNMVAKSKTRNQLRQAVMESQGRVGGILERYGIVDPEIRSFLTRLNVDTYNEDLRGLIDEVGADVPTWETMTIDGKPTSITGPHLPLEHISRFMHLPDQRAVRRLTTKFNFLTSRGTDIPVLTPLKIKAGKEVTTNPDIVGVPRLPIAAADFIMSEFLKPGWLMRLAWPIRVIGEEQLRMAGAGLDSAVKHPISYIATVIGGDQNRLTRMLGRMTPGVGGKMEISPNGQLFAETEELTKVTYRAHSGWLDQPGTVRTNIPTIYNKNNVHELADWRASWAHELALLHHDPVSNMVANKTFDEAVDWLYMGPGNKYRRELMDAHPGNLETRAQVEQYIKTVTDRISRITANHPDLIDVVKTGKFSKFKGDEEIIGDVFVDAPRINPQFTTHLRGYEDVGPDKIKGAATAMVKGKDDFMPRYNAVVDRVMSTLMGTPTSTLSRAPAFKQFVWRRTAELLPFADDAARETILANARKAGLNKRQMANLERAAKKGKKGTKDLTTTEDVPLDEAMQYADPNVPVDRLISDEGRYLDGMWNGTGLWEGQGIKNVGITNPIRLSDSGIISDGMHRLALAKRQGLTTVPIERKTSVTGFAGKLNTDDIDLLAKGYAIDDTKTLLYDLSERSQITDIMRILVPFGEAWKEVLTRWAKLATIQGPGGIPLPGKPVRRLQQVITGARGTDFGNFMGAGTDPITGKDRGFFYENEFGQEVYTYPGSEWLTSALTKVPVPLTGRVQGLNMFGNILPGLGPVAQIPAAWFLQDKPEYDWWREQLLPFGAPGSEETEDIFSLRDYMPAYAKTAIDWIANGGDDRVYNSSIMYTASYLYSTGEYGDTQPEQQRLLADAKDAARDLYKIRAFGQFTLPSSPTFEWVTKSKDGQLLNTRILAEEFYNLQQDDYDTAVEKFLDMYGPYAIGAIVPHSRNVISAVPTSLEGAKWVSQHKSVKKKYGLVYGFFAPEGEFHMPTFARNYITGEREGITPEEWLNLRDTMIGNYHYSRAKEMLGPDANSPSKEQADWLRTQRGSILEMYPNWNNQVGLAQRPENEQMISQLYDASKNRIIRGTNAGKGLVEYLAYRDQAVTQAEAEGFVSFKTANDLAPTRQWLTDQAYRLIAKYPEFERLWDVVFSREMEDATVEPDQEAA